MAPSGDADTGPPSPRRLRRDAEQNRARILDAAGRLMAERGVGVPLEDIACAAGVGIGTLYRRFPAREDLLEALFQDRMAAYVADAEESLRAEDGWAGLTTYLELTLSRLISDRALSQILEADPAPGKKWAVRERLEPLARELVGRAQRSGRLRRDFTVGDLVVVQRMLVEVGLLTSPVDPDLWRRYLALVLDGLQGATPLPGRPIDMDRLQELGRGRHRL